MQTINVPGQKALETLEQLRTDYSRTGLYPILFGGKDEYNSFDETLMEDFDSAEILAKSERVSPANWFAKRRRRTRRLADVDNGGEISDCGDMGMITHCDILTKEPFDAVTIGLVTLNRAWEAFAHLNWGAWNDCPEPEVHCALHRSWQEKYGAKVVSITGSTVQCSVSHPPTNTEAAYALAREHFFYCPDIVEQGTETLSALASILINAKTWYFWWD